MSRRQQYLLDTNIVAETRRSKADQRVITFLSAAEPSALYISVLTLGELRKGVALKKRTDPEIAKRLAHWVDGLEYGFGDRILGINAATATVWGELSAQRPRPVIDTLLAATAIAHDLIFVTRNTTDVQDIKINLLNPWK